MNLVFFYGTIKSDQPNHFVISDVGQERCQLIGTGSTETKWPLVIASKYNIPYLLDCEGEGHNIKGEVYEMDDDLLNTIDELEGYPECYDRRKIHVRIDKIADRVVSREGAVIECWLYMVPRFRPEMKDLETFASYDSNGAHGKKLVKIYDKEKGWLEPLDVIRKEMAYWYVKKDNT